MADELRWVLVLISALVIGGLLIHGLWSVRKKEALSSAKASANRAAAKPLESAPTAEPQERAAKEPALVAEDAPAPSFKAEEPEQSEPLSQQDPTFSDDLPSIQLDDDDIKAPAEALDASQEVLEDTVEESDDDELLDFIALHIQMPEGLQMQGARLLPVITTLGFKYSEDGFFNRHMDAAGQEPVIFRLVNMYNPGTFDLDNMEQFATIINAILGENYDSYNLFPKICQNIYDKYFMKIYDANLFDENIDYNLLIKATMMAHEMN